MGLLMGRFSIFHEPSNKDLQFLPDKSSSWAAAFPVLLNKGELDVFLTMSNIVQCLRSQHGHSLPKKFAVPLQILFPMYMCRWFHCQRSFYRLPSHQAIHDTLLSPYLFSGFLAWQKHTQTTNFQRRKNEQGLKWAFHFMLKILFRFRHPIWLFTEQFYLQEKDLNAISTFLDYRIHVKLTIDTACPASFQPSTYFFLAALHEIQQIVECVLRFAPRSRERRNTKQATFRR